MRLSSAFRVSTQAGLARRCVTCLVAACMLVMGWSVRAPAGPRPVPKPMRQQGPEFLNFEELKALSANPYPTGAIRSKYDALWTTPIVSNEAYKRGARPLKLSDPSLGKFLRVVTWNIEQSLHMDEAIEAFTDEEAFIRQLNPRRAKPGSRRYRKALAQRALLEKADVILLQEMDIGVKRSGYRDAARDLAEALDMNYAYLPEYLEVDPVLLETEVIPFREGEVDAEATAYYAVDPQRYKGLFGVAVLSRYPIVHAEGFRLFTQGYDWYWQERKKVSFLERLRRFGAKEVFLERLHRQMKLGGRVYFRVDLHVPDLPEQQVSIINVHLEIKCTPQKRAEQMAEVLNYIKQIPHPVILAGDINSAPADLSPTSTPRLIERNISAPEFWASRVLEYLTPYALVVNVIRFVSNCTKNYQNPPAGHIPVLAPNRVAELFRLIERFRFDDGGAFDFRGDRRRSVGRPGTLSNSNEQDGWAFRTTFRVNRTLFRLIGKYRLDWVFVKAYLTRPRDKQGSYRFAPHFGRTLNAVNKYLTTRISDHDPNVVDLPLQEPPQTRHRSRGFAHAERQDWN